MSVKNIQFTRIEIQIVKFLFKHYNDRYNARQLAKLLNINHAHASKLCNLLSDKKLLIKEDIGNAVYFSFNYASELSVKFIDYLLSLEIKDFPKWLTVLVYSLKKFEPYIQLGLIFGSAIKTKDFHDVDVLLIYKPIKSKEVRMVQDEIRKSNLIVQPIRYVEITEKDILLNKEDKIFYNILSDSLIFYNAEKYVKVVRKCRK